MIDLVIVLIIFFFLWLTYNIKGPGAKLIITLIFGILSFIFLTMFIEYDRPIAIETNGEIIELGQNPEQINLILDPDDTIDDELKAKKFTTEDIELNVNLNQNIEYTISNFAGTMTRSRPNLNLIRGNIYRFRIPNPIYGAYPFYFSTTNKFGGGYYDSEYISGMTRDQGVDELVMSIKVTEATPSTLYYHAGTKINMGGKLNIIDSIAPHKESVIL